MADIDGLAGAVFASVKTALAKALAPIGDSITALGERLAEQDAHIRDLRDAVSSLPEPKDGKDGKDGLNGADGKDGADGEKGQDGINGKDGASAYEIAKGMGFAGTELDWVASLKGKDGSNGIDGRDGRDGKEGAPGRHALQLQILPRIDPSESYARGTFASYRGGLIHAVRSTDPITGSLDAAGWESIVVGVDEASITAKSAREFVFAVKMSDGKTVENAITLPAMIYRGVFKSGEKYAKGDTATLDGSLWHCNTDTSARPGSSEDWTLCAKRGRDGRNGEKGDPGPRGERGMPGANGADRR